MSDPFEHTSHDPSDPYLNGRGFKGLEQLIHEDLKGSNGLRESVLCPPVPLVQLHNWSTRTAHPYRAPEAGGDVLCLGGEVCGHPDFADGEIIKTAPLEWSKGRRVQTVSGTQYQLVGPPDLVWVAFLRDQGVTLDLDDPIKLKNKEADMATEKRATTRLMCELWKDDGPRFRLVVVKGSIVAEEYGRDALGGGVWLKSSRSVDHVMACALMALLPSAGDPEGYSFEGRGVLGVEVSDVVAFERLSNNGAAFLHRISTTLGANLDLALLVATEVLAHGLVPTPDTGETGRLDPESLPGYLVEYVGEILHIGPLDAQDRDYHALADKLVTLFKWANTTTDMTDMCAMAAESLTEIVLGLHNQGSPDTDRAEAQLVALAVQLKAPSGRVTTESLWAEIYAAPVEGKARPVLRKAAPAVEEEPPWSVAGRKILRLEERFNGLERRMGQMINDHGRINTRLDELARHTNERCGSQGRTLNEFERKLGDLSSRLTGLYAQMQIFAHDHPLPEPDPNPNDFPNDANNGEDPSGD